MKHFYFLFLLLLSLCTKAQKTITYTSNEVEQSKKYIQGNKFQKDFLLYVDMLKQSHPAFANKGMPFNIDSTLTAGYKQCKKCKEQAEFSVILQEIAAKLHDGHTSISSNYSTDEMYPMYLFIDDEGVYLKSVQQGFETHLNKKIVKVNGNTISRVCDSFRKTISYGNEWEFRKMFKNTTQSLQPWKELGLCNSDSSIVLTFLDGDSLKLRPLSKRNIHLKDKLEGFAKAQILRRVQLLRQGNTPFSYTLIPGKSTCYLLFDQCEDRNTLLEKSYWKVQHSDSLKRELEKNLLRIPVFSDFLNQMFQTMKDSSIQTLVIDVRQNSGGNSRLCNELLMHLKKELKLPTVYIRESNLAHEHYKALGKDSIAWINANPQTVYSDKDIYEGNVIFVQGERTFSSAGLLITEAVDNGIGTLIGDYASYTPSHYGDIIYWSLPNTQTTGTISNRYFLRPAAEKAKESYIKPDVLLPATFKDYIKGYDPCWDWIINKQRSN